MSPHANRQLSKGCCQIPCCRARALEASQNNEGLWRGCRSHRDVISQKNTTDLGSGHLPLSLALRTSKWVYLIDLLNQPCPVFPVIFGSFYRLQDTTYPFILILFSPFTSGYIAVISIVTDHLFALVRDMRAHGR